jgi:hypothetical protein
VLVEGKAQADHGKPAGDVLLGWQGRSLGRPKEDLLGEVAGLLGIAHDQGQPPDEPGMVLAEGRLERSRGINQCLGRQCQLE